MATDHIPFSYDTLLETISRPIYTGKPGKTIVITTIHVRDSIEENYSVEFLLITTGRNTQGMLFSVQLLPGYFLFDDTHYKLAPNAAIWAKSDKITVDVVINGYEEIATS